jgi:putative ABC transport system ATP-binding protein
MAVAPSAQPLVDIRDLSKHFGQEETRVDALREISLRVYAGQVVGLLGPSGSGKSTLLNVIGCILEPSSGQMLLDGQMAYDGRWMQRDLRRLRLESIGFIFQFHNLLPFLNALENVAVVLEIAGVSAGEARRRALELLRYLQVDHRRDAMPSQLSGGEAQRVAIARALANRPALLLADEPTGELDARTGREVIELFQRLNADGTTLVVVTHDEALARAARRVVHMVDGRVVTDG